MTKNQQPGFTQEEIDAWHQSREKGRPKPDYPHQIDLGIECIHCRQPVGFGGNLEYALCERCLHGD